MDFKSEIKELIDEFLKIEKEMELKNALVDGLKVQVSSLDVERDDLKFSSENKAAFDTKLLELQQLKERLELALDKLVEIMC